MKIDAKVVTLDTLYERVQELGRAVEALTEQLDHCATEQDLIGATQDYALRSELADLQATLMEAVREATDTPFE